MNTVTNCWDSAKRQKHLKFPVAPQFRTKIREKGKQEKNMRMDKSKENTLIYFHMYIYTYHKHMLTQVHIFTHTHYVLFKSDSIN